MKLQQSIEYAIESKVYTLIRKYFSNTIASDIVQAKTENNWLYRKCLKNRDSTTKRKFNAKIPFMQTIWHTHKQDKWDMFLDLDHKNTFTYTFT